MSILCLFPDILSMLHGKIFTRKELGCKLIILSWLWSYANVNINIDDVLWDEGRLLPQGVKIDDQCRRNEVYVTLILTTKAIVWHMLWDTTELACNYYRSVSNSYKILPDKFAWCLLITKSTLFLKQLLQQYSDPILLTYHAFYTFMYYQWLKITLSFPTQGLFQHVQLAVQQ